jgi:hypothetical protein
MRGFSEWGTSGQLHAPAALPQGGATTGMGYVKEENIGSSRDSSVTVLTELCRGRLTVMTKLRSRP